MIYFLSLVLLIVPEPGINTRCKVVDVYDGDTLTVEIKYTVKVRLLDCWAPEVRGENKEEGFKSRDHLRKIVLNKEAILSVPSEKANSLDDLFTFGRVLGYIWVDGKNVSKTMVEDGYAKPSR